MAALVALLLVTLYNLATATFSQYRCLTDLSNETQLVCTEENKHSKLLHPVNSSLFRIYEDPNVGTTENYFKTSLYNSHCDLRYCKLDSKLTSAQQQHTLTVMFQQWTEFAAEQKLTYWLSHGTLLGWYWQQDLLPWEADTLSVQILMRDLVRYYVHYRGHLLRDRYFVDMSPLVEQGSGAEGVRFIDTTTGYFINLSPVSYNNITDTLVESGTEDGGKTDTADIHRYKVESLFPLRRTAFAGSITWVPNNTTDVLSAEYGRAALTATKYRHKPLIDVQVSKQLRYRLGGTRYRYDHAQWKWVSLS